MKTLDKIIDIAEKVLNFDKQKKKLIPDSQVFYTFKGRMC